MIYRSGTLICNIVLADVIIQFAELQNIAVSQQEDIMYQKLTRLSILVLLCLLSFNSYASTRSTLPIVSISSDKEFLSPGETFRLRLDVENDGFTYVYSMDSRGYVHLLFPVNPEDGRGEVAAGQYVEIFPLAAGHLAGLEHIVAVYTREYRKIKKSRREFLAPDPQDLEKVHARLTRDRHELDNYSFIVVEIDGPVIEEETVGVTVHDHHYDYWCYYCDCWHPACSANHCWCGYEVVHHYHSSYHYSHCFMWGHWHSHWSPPVFYVYIYGGSNWDYDTSHWRTHANWQRRRWQSESWWRNNRGVINSPDDWRSVKQRSQNVAHSKKLDRLLADTKTESLKSSKSGPQVWTTQESTQKKKSQSGSEWKATTRQSSKKREKPAKKSFSIFKSKKDDSSTAKTNSKKSKSTSKSKKSTKKKTTKKSNSLKKDKKSTPKKTPTDKKE
jgi:hypothetical protein